MAKILVTGASGFVGRHILQALAAIDHHDLEYVAACRDPGRLPADYRGEIRVGDLRDEAYLDRLLVGVDIVCHAAGWTSFLDGQRLVSELYLEPAIELFNRAIEWRVTRFVNLSSIAVTTPARRNDADAPGRPRRYHALPNCMLAMEDYLHANAARGCSVINLRAGIYSGRHLQRGLLPWLSQLRSTPWVRGRYGYLPLVDGRDLAQAFLRAALTPETTRYACYNILGPDIPRQQEVLRFLVQQGHARSLMPGVPSALSQLLLGMAAGLSRYAPTPPITPTLAGMMLNPIMDNRKAIEGLGYDPEISWQASLYEWLQDNRDHPQTGSLLQADMRPLDIR